MRVKKIGTLSIVDSWNFQQVQYENYLYMQIQKNEKKNITKDT